MTLKELKVERNMVEMCVLCMICDEPIPIHSINNAYPRICPECKKRLKEVLYGKENKNGCDK